MYYYSPSQNAFFPEDLKEDYISAGSFPDDVVEVSDAVWFEFAGSPAPDGKQCAPGRHNLPVWVDIPLPDIEDARRRKHDAINRWRNAQESAGYILTFNGHQWDYSRATQERMTLSVQMARQNKLPEDFIWTDADNNDVPMTAGELLSLSDAIEQAMFSKGLQIHIRQRTMKEEINALTTVQAVMAYKVGWPQQEAE
ncbi:TPA: DUF4376 domain-containing protein [Salmonella enterica]|uniref:DUF4376 domain-containing protein n=1 Tax=Salmonella enterica TaxID=28901 RepID=A0A756L9V9_SALER|nr:DUF4376 domain-containing protein [Salmonella enterica]HAG0017481.1 DUF4376 domain-containing protein [Salmonella enterica]